MHDEKSGLIMLKFHLLYDDKIAAFLGEKGDKKSGKNLKIVFPKDFNPEEGRAYECTIISTGAEFIYEGTAYDHCLAECNAVATLADKVFHSSAGPKHSGAMAAAFGKVGYGK